MLHDRPNLLILGGTGFVGRAFAARWVALLGAGSAVTAIATRRLAHGRAVQPLPTVELVQADVHDDASLARLVAGRDAVVNLVAILHGDDEAFRRVHEALPRRLAAACQSAGVRRVVHVSAIGVAGDAPSKYLRSKWAGEQALTGSGLDVTVLRPSVIFGAGDRFLNMFASLQALAPAMPLAGAEAQFQPVWVEDVAEAIARCLQRPATIGKVIECTGPKVYTLAELVRLAGRWSGHARPVLPMPMVVGRLQAALLSLLPGEPMLSADNLDSMRVPNVATASRPQLGSLDIEPTALEVVGPAMLGQHDGLARLDRWRALARRG